MNNGVRSPHPVVVVWEGGKRYRGGAPGGATIVVDGGREAGPSPVDSLLVALASCSAIDVVEILAKRRTPVTALEVHCEFSRAEKPPRRLTDVDLRFSVSTSSELLHVENAVRLSLEKYCSVSNTFAPDITISWTIDLRHIAEVGG